jgi:hypothetical protein
MNSFQTEHLSWPTPGNGVFGDLVVLPLPKAANFSQIGVNSINATAWNAVNIAGKIVLIGREVGWSTSWQQTFKTRLTSQPPKAVVYTWWYDWMAFTPPMASSSGGRPGADAYYWNLHVPAGFVNYQDGLWIRNRETAINLWANVSIPSVIGNGTHYNVVARIGGFVDPDKIVIVSGHYDTVVDSGFCDNGAGSAGVLELARVFAQAVEAGVYKPICTIVFVAFAAEEFHLVGSVNYVKQHEDEMPNIRAVINLDCIGNSNFHVTRTNSGSEFDLDQVVINAARDLNTTTQSDGPGGSDQETFRDPAWADSNYRGFWGQEAGISDASPVQSSIMLISYPLRYSDQWYIGKPGWIHTQYDNSTSTTVFTWVKANTLANHIKIAALTIVRVCPDAPPMPRDLAVTRLNTAKTIVGQNYTLQVTFTVENQGGYAEHFTVTVYAGTTAIRTFQDIALKNATSTTMVLTWNTAGFPKGNYTIEVVAPVLPGETDTADNTLNGGTVFVTAAGDVTSHDGQPDGDVDMRDIGLLCHHFGDTPATVDWNPNLDLNSDGVVDMQDIGAACINFTED